jgi:hypothetical protein
MSVIMQNGRSGSRSGYEQNGQCVDGKCVTFHMHARVSVWWDKVGGVWGHKGYLRLSVRKYWTLETLERKSQTLT